MNRVATFSMALLLSGCDYTGDWLFPSTDNPVPDVWVLTAEDGGPLVPVDLFAEADPAQALNDSVVYAEVAASRTTLLGGVTAEFIGTGGPVCIWVDPETATWSPPVGPRPGGDALKFRYPDNLFDDGDLDLYVGLSAYYNGSPGETLGNFNTNYEDELGNLVPISLSECLKEGVGQDENNAHAGRGTLEFCDLPVTLAGIGYTIVLETWSAPLDDDRLGFGLLVADGTCGDVVAAAAGIPQGTAFVSDTAIAECIILGESLEPLETSWGPYYGLSTAPSWGDSIAFENAFCAPNEGTRNEPLVNYCEDEAALVLSEGKICGWNDPGEDSVRCYCGDPLDLPNGQF